MLWRTKAIRPTVQGRAVFDALEQLLQGAIAMQAVDLAQLLTGPLFQGTQPLKVDLLVKDRCSSSNWLPAYAAHSG